MRERGSVRTRHQVSLDGPTFRGFGQFSIHILSLKEQPLSSRFQQRICLFEEFAERRQRARCHYVNAARRVSDKVCNPLRMHLYWRPNTARGFAEEARFLLDAFDEIHLRPRSLSKSTRNDQTRKSSAGAEIDPYSRFWRQCNELQGIGDVAGPQYRFGRGCDQIDPLLPFQEKPHKTVEAGFCFT